MTLWDYALALWSRPQVETIAFDLQNAHGQSIPLLL